jgi:hypothetical protein
MILFLDFDGVLSTSSDHHAGPRVNPHCAEALNHLVAEYHPRIVVTSSWRFHYSADEFSKILSAAGVHARVIGVTPNLPRPAGSIPRPTRGQEIQAWLAEQPETQGPPFLILEDQLDLTPLEAWAYYTDLNTGLCLDDLPKIHQLIDRQLSAEESA